jgi:Tfp pilus assembly protein PilX
MKQEGYVLVTTLMIVFIISLGISSIFLHGILEYRSSNNNVANNLAFQSAENAIEKTLGNLQVSKAEMNKVLAIDIGENKEHCIDETGVLQTVCTGVFLNTDQTIKSENKISRNIGECIAYGNSDQQSGCFVIQGIGRIPSLELSIKNKQEIKINTINANNNGVYEY